MVNELIPVRDVMNNRHMYCDDLSLSQGSLLLLRLLVIRESLSSLSSVAGVLTPESWL